MALNDREIFWDWEAACYRGDMKAQQELARYVLEDLAEIADIFHKAKEDLKRLTGDPSFYGYTSSSACRVRQEVQALYERLQQCKPQAGGELSYVLEPIESVRTKHKQRLRLAREVLFWGHGTCIDWVLLFAACVYKAHIYPLIIVTQGHAILGYWLEELDAKAMRRVILTPKEIVKNFSNGRLKVVNATRIPPDESGKRKPFEEAEKEGNSHIPYALFAVNICAAREMGINSLLPLKGPSGHTLTPAEHFQYRPELEEIKRWWGEKESYGVLALLGIGGAGKTALVHRFLAELPGSEVQEKGASKEESLPPPDGLFVWSFSIHHDVDHCAREFYNYLTGERVPKATFEQVQDVLSTNYRGCRILLVLDGVEKLQIASGIVPEEAGTFGQFRPEGVPLGHFLAWCCDGPRPLHVLITSRLSLTDLRCFSATGGYHEVELRNLPLESARALLRACGVKGLDWQLDELIKDVGPEHPQTLDLLGNAIRIWCDGDVTRKDELPLLEKVPGIRDKAWARNQVFRFYQRNLPPATLEVLQFLTLFADLTIDERLNLMATLLQKDSINLRSHLLALSHEYKLLPLRSPTARREWELHPAVKDYFYSAFNQSIRTAYHEKLARFLTQKVCSTGLVKPGEWEGLLVLYELIHQFVAAGQIQRAFDVYLTNMGAYDHIAQLNANSLGLRTVTEMLNSPHVDLLLPWQKARLLNDAGGFLRALGVLEKGLQCYREAFRVLETVVSSDESVKKDIQFNRSVALRNTSRILILQGRLKDAQREAQRAYEHECEVGDKEGMQISLCMAAYATGLQGAVDKALKMYKHAVTVGGAEEMTKKEYILHWSHLMLLAGKDKGALAHIRKIVSKYRVPDLIKQFANLVRILATIRSSPSNFQQEWADLTDIERWAKSVGRIELQIRAQQAKIELALKYRNLTECEQVLREAIPLAERCGYGIFWIDLQVAKGRWELACGQQLCGGRGVSSAFPSSTPSQWFAEAENSALRALNGQVKNSAEPAPQPDLPEEELARLGARHPQCGYVWGEGDALHLLGEALLAQAQYIGPNGRDSKGRSYEQLIEEAHRVAEEALAVRHRIQDPKAQETQNLLRKIQAEEEGGKM
jgi:tetratricopeptide (TPR) repeat protein